MCVCVIKCWKMNFVFKALMSRKTKREKFNADKKSAALGT